MEQAFRTACAACPVLNWGMNFKAEASQATSDLLEKSAPAARARPRHGLNQSLLDQVGVTGNALPLCCPERAVSVKRP